MIIFKCPVCGEQMEAPEQLRGQTLVCPNCGEPVGVHGINPPLTPDSGTRHTDLPVYATRNWSVIFLIFIVVIGSLWYAIRISNWEYRHEKAILALCQDTIQLIQSQNYRDGIKKYMELESLLAGNVVTKPENLVEIKKARNLFAEVEYMVRSDTMEIAYYMEMYNQWQSQRQRYQ